MRIVEPNSLQGLVENVRTRIRENEEYIYVPDLVSGVSRLKN